MIKLLVVDDHQMFLDGIKSIFENDRNIEVVAQAKNGKEALEIVQHQAIDLILLDVNMPEMDGIEVCKKVKYTNPNIKILALTMHNQASFLTQMVENGASGYVLKNTGKTELLKAIDALMNGKQFFSKAAAQKLIYKKEKKKTKAQTIEIPKISRREKEILTLIVDEFTTQEIANKLFISLSTVETHRSNLLAKLKVRNTAGLVREAVKNKLLS